MESQQKMLSTTNKQIIQKQKQENMFQTKGKDSYPETNINEMEICDLPGRKFKIPFPKMLTEVSRAMNKQNENFYKQIENDKKKYQAEIRNEE